jgi:putative ABC transport system ATP-binding protein
LGKALMSAVIALFDLYRNYQTKTGDTPVLCGLTLEVNLGEFVAVLGSSRCGKTTLLRVLACLDDPDSGSYTLFGERVNEFTERARARLRSLRIGIIAQKPTLLADATVLRNIMVPLAYTDTPMSSREARTLAALRSVHMEEFATRLCRDLTVDQQQRVQIARALVNDPDLILADEPFASLGPASKDIVLRLFADLRGSKRTIIVMSQDPFIASFADSCYLLTNGTLTEHPLMQERETIEEAEEDIYQPLLEAEEEAKTIFEYPISWTLEAEELGVPVVFSIDEALKGNFVKEEWWRQ